MLIYGQAFWLVDASIQIDWDIDLSIETGNVGF